MLGLNRSMYDLYSSRSSKQISMISLSDNTPSALITMNNGIGFLTLAITTTICLFSEVVVGVTIRTDTTLVGLEAFSDTDLTSAAYSYLSPAIFLTYNILSANFS